MKRLFLTVAILGTLTNAMAEPADAQPEVNPFNGVTKQQEVSKRDLEQMKLRTQMSEELVKQKSLELELSNLPVKKEAEVSAARASLDALQEKRDEVARQKEQQAEAKQYSGINAHHEFSRVMRQCERGSPALQSAIQMSCVRRASQG